VVTATERQERTFLPPEDFCPLCPTTRTNYPTEVPAPDYQMAVFENRFPSFHRQPPAPAVEGRGLYRVRPAQGACEVVLYSARHHHTLADMRPQEIRHLVEVWADRYRELGALPYVEYVLIFENKGEEIGVTLTHPHGQIYAFPYIPPIVQRELDSAERHWIQTGRCLYCDIHRQEEEDGRRLVAENFSFSAFVPFYARWPYETHIFSRAHRPSLLNLDDGERWDLAHLLKATLQKFDGLWDRSLPYMMVMHQAPSDGREYPYYHFHIEFYPPYRTADKLKYRASGESGAGTFINDTLPEEKAAELRMAAPRKGGP
jgi:UDPglucose--hexose-1-phosphate uridylyltransferase